MGIKVEIINKPIYVNKPEYDVSLNTFRSGKSNKVWRIWSKKTRGTCIEGVMMNKKMYRVTIDKEYLADYKARHSADVDVKYEQQDFMVDIMNMTGGHEIAVISCDAYDKIAWSNIDNYIISLNAWGQPRERCDTFTLEFYLVEDFVELSKTKKEQEQLLKEENRKKTEYLNEILLKDTVITVLKEAGVGLQEYKNSWRYKGRSYLAVTNKKDWNKLVVLAINNYINDIAKEHGFKVNPPKFMANANITYERPLFFMDDIEMLNQEN